MEDNLYLIGMDAMSPYLEHHGIKGQKWYRRRFQNEDGSLTPLGRARLGLGNAARGARSLIDKMTKKKGKQKISKSTSKEGEKKEKPETPEEHSEKVKKAMASGDKAEIKKYAKEVDYSTLKSAIDKADLMAKLNTVPEPKDNVKEFLNRAVDLTGSVAKLGDNATTLWNLYAKYSNSMHGTSYPIIGAGGKKEKEEKKKDPLDSLVEFMKDKINKAEQSGKNQKDDKPDETEEPEDNPEDKPGKETKNPEPEVWSGDVEGTGSSFTKSYSNDTSWQQASDNINLKRIGMN